ncbi:MAG: hypothetical protein ACTSO4_18010, partial [Promethearchaeota archaeon]
KGKVYMWTSNQPFVLPIQILNFEELTQPNQAKEIQLNNNLLKEVYDEIMILEQIEKRIYKKFKEVLDYYEIDINDRKKIFSDEMKPKISKTLYKQLDVKEKEFLDNEKGIAYYNNEPFALSFKYFNVFYEKARHFLENFKE